MAFKMAKPRLKRMALCLHFTTPVYTDYMGMQMGRITVFVGETTYFYVGKLLNGTSIFRGGTHTSSYMRIVLVHLGLKKAKSSLKPYGSVWTHHVTVETPDALRISRVG